MIHIYQKQLMKKVYFQTITFGHITKSLSIFGLLYCLVFSAQAQTCCSGGVPMSNNLGLPASVAKTWQFSFNYDKNVLKTLKEGVNEQSDPTGERTTHSLMFRVGYSFTDRISVEAFVPHITQIRDVKSFGGGDPVRTKTSGIGDAVLLAKFRITKPENTSTVWQIGGGAKFPTAASDLKNSLGIPLNIDMQPGSGAWDAVFWSGFSQQMAFRPSLTFTATTLVTRKGTNNEHLGTGTYQLGSDMQVIAGFADKLLVGSAILNPNIQLRWRSADKDNSNGVELDFTGGQWVFLDLGMGWNIMKNLSVNLMGEIPMYAWVRGSQLSPTYRINAGLYYTLSGKDNTVQPIPALK